jgi:uncharacterized protein with PIN domain
MNSDTLPRFVADTMLGRLVRWLRILGCDVLYGPNFSGKGLLRAARDERRIVLTRDKRLARSFDLPPLLLVEDDRFREQVRQVVTAFGLEGRARLFSRCASCNAEIEDVGPEAAAAVVPEFVLATQPGFRRCTGCGHLYWQATHVERVRRELAGMGIAPHGIAPGVAL